MLGGASRIVVGRFKIGGVFFINFIFFYQKLTEVFLECNF